MNVEYINPFIEASQSVIDQTTGFKASVGKPYIKSLPYGGDNVIVLIGLTGKIHGNVTVTFNYNTASKVVSAMMGGMPIQEIDEMFKSAIAELCNMILGNAAMIFSQNSINIDITPPTVMTGNNIQLSPGKAVVVCIPLLIEDNCSIELDISYVEN